MNNWKAGWVLIILSFLILAAFNRLSLLVILVPAATLLGCGFLWLGQNMNRIRPGLK